MAEGETSDGCVLSMRELLDWTTEVLGALRVGLPVSDDVFDRIYPHKIRCLSSVHWTPVRVAMKAAALLAPHPGARVLDVGSGAGKLCFVGAQVSRGVFLGVEQRAWLVDVCKDVANRCGIDRARFVHGNAMHQDWRYFDSFYFYNPFIENILDDEDQIDLGVVHTDRQLNFYVAGTLDRLDQAKVDARVVTFHGFGGILPDCYHLKEVVDVGLTSNLELWIKERHPRSRALVEPAAASVSPVEQQAGTPGAPHGNGRST